MQKFRTPSAEDPELSEVPSFQGCLFTLISYFAYSLTFWHSVIFVDFDRTDPHLRFFSLSRSLSFLFLPSTYSLQTKSAACREHHTLLFEAISLATENSLFMGQSLCADETNHLLQHFFVGSISDNDCGLCHLDPLNLMFPLWPSRSRISIKLSRTANQTYLYSVKQRWTAIWVPSALPSPPLFRHLIVFHIGLGQCGVVVFFR